MKKILYLLSIYFIASCPESVTAQYKFLYTLDKPVVKHILPEILNEVSGLTDLDSAHIACVQDEIGTVFIYNFIKGEIIARHKFDSIGDFEGLTYTGKSLFILRSDGRLTEWNDFRTGTGTFKHYTLPLQTANNEGLCYDRPNNRLLIAAKSKPINHDKANERLIYAFDLKSKKVYNAPVYKINIQSLENKTRDLGIFTQETNPKGTLKPYNFRPSSLAVHPFFDHIYIISAADKLLIVVNRKAEIVHAEKLNPEVFPKAEGITFLKDGTMIITNEAATKVPTLLVYKMGAQ